MASFKGHIYSVAKSDTPPPAIGGGHRSLNTAKNLIFNLTNLDANSGIE